MSYCFLMFTICISGGLKSIGMGLGLGGTPLTNLAQLSGTQTILPLFSLYREDGVYWCWVLRTIHVGQVAVYVRAGRLLTTVTLPEWWVVIMSGVTLTVCA